MLFSEILELFKVHRDSILQSNKYSAQKNATTLKNCFLTIFSKSETRIDTAGI